jgi:RsiW-degrading membrane proteinase PrsW (M82 family)
LIEAPEGPPESAAPSTISGLLTPAEARRQRLGFALWAAGVALGAVLGALFVVAEVQGSTHPTRELAALATGATLALPSLLVYLAVPLVIDRFDPEPWWCLAMAFAWGAIAATGLASAVNTAAEVALRPALGFGGAGLATKVVVAPIVEELAKGAVVLGFFRYLRREFDGVVDGIIYATFAALGFAAVENVFYYADAALRGDAELGRLVLLRGLLAPWGHPLYTSMVGIGVGVARESTRRWVRVAAPAGGFLVGALLHATWNAVPVWLGMTAGLGPERASRIFTGSLGLWAAFVGAFALLVIALVARKGRIIRQHLADEVLFGTLDAEELELAGSPVGGLVARASWRGRRGADLVHLAARLALAKWHTARASRHARGTLSSDRIAPLRRALARVRRELAARDSRPPRADA